jgi:hypothetical protein
MIEIENAAKWDIVFGLNTPVRKQLLFKAINFFFSLKSFALIVHQWHYHSDLDCNCLENQKSFQLLFVSDSRDFKSQSYWLSICAHYLLWSWEKQTAWETNKSKGSNWHSWIFLKWHSSLWDATHLRCLPNAAAHSEHLPLTKCDL